MTHASGNRPPRSDDAEQFACHAARLLADDRCENVLVLDVRGLSQVSDFFVIGTGTSERQMRSISGDLKDLADLENQSVFKSEGRGGSSWVVIDFVDVVVHILTADQRAYYDLESLWGDARKVPWASRTEPGQFATLRARRRNAG